MGGQPQDDTKGQEPRQSTARQLSIAGWPRSIAYTNYSLTVERMQGIAGRVFPGRLAGPLYPAANALAMWPPPCRRQRLGREAPAFLIALVRALAGLYGNREIRRQPLAIIGHSMGEARVGHFNAGKHRIDFLDPAGRI